MAENLKPCPFCGGAVTVARYDNWWSVIASGTDPKLSCRCRVFMESELFHDEESKQRTREKLIEKWNKRPNPWHTGTPTEEGWYLLECNIGNSDKNYYTTDYWSNACKDWTVNRVIRWQKIEEGEEVNG